MHQLCETGKNMINTNVIENPKSLLSVLNALSLGEGGNRGLQLLVKSPANAEGRNEFGIGTRFVMIAGR